MEILKKFDSKKHLLNMEKMDNTHKEFIDLYNKVDTESNSGFKDNLILLIHHTKRHFDTEEKLMDEFHYPRSKEHKEEHRKVLKEMSYFVEISASIFGLKMLKAYYLEKIPEWFDCHLMNMDSDLAHFLKNNQKLL